MKYHNIPTLFDNQASLINGKNIGTDSVRYIQDAGQKTAGTTYIDRNTNELYVCVTTTDSVNNDGNFSKFNLKEAFNKLDRLNRDYITTEEVFVPSSSFKQEGEWWYTRVNINTDRIISFVMKEMSGWGEFATIIQDGLIEIGVYYPTLTTANKVSFTVVRLNSI